MINIAVVGVGFMGSMHLNVYQQLENVMVTAICDVRRDSLSPNGGFQGGNINVAQGQLFDPDKVRTYDDYEELLSAGGFDAVDLCIPTYLHAEFIIRALKAGYHVFCEKPLAGRNEDIDAIIEASRKTDKIVGVGQCLRYWPAYEAVHDVIRSGNYGSVSYAEFSRYSSPPTWAKDNWTLRSDLSGNAALDLHVHDVDLVLHYFGVPRSVRSVGLPSEDGGFEHISTFYRYEDKVVSAAGGWHFSSSYPLTMRMLVQFQRATVSLDLGKDDPVLIYPDQEAAQPLTFPPGDGYFHELSAFVDAIESGDESRVVPVESAALSARLCLLEIDAARSGKELPFELRISGEAQ